MSEESRESRSSRTATGVVLGGLAVGAILGAATPAQAAAAPAAAAPATSLCQQISDAFTAGAVAPGSKGSSAIICDPL